MIYQQWYMHWAANKLQSVPWQTYFCWIIGQSVAKIHTGPFLTVHRRHWIRTVECLKSYWFTSETQRNVYNVCVRYLDQYKITDMIHKCFRFYLQKAINHLFCTGCQSSVFSFPATCNILGRVLVTFKKYMFFGVGGLKKTKVKRLPLCIFRPKTRDAISNYIYLLSIIVEDLGVIHVGLLTRGITLLENIKSRNSDEWIWVACLRRSTL